MLTICKSVGLDVLTPSTSLLGSDAGDCPAPSVTSPIRRPWFYEVLVVAMVIGKKVLDIPCVKYNTASSIVDSGTSNLRLPSEVLTFSLCRLIILWYLICFFSLSHFWSQMVLWKKVSLIWSLYIVCVMIWVFVSFSFFMWHGRSSTSSSSSFFSSLYMYSRQ